MALASSRRVGRLGCVVDIYGGCSRVTGREGAGKGAHFGGLGAARQCKIRGPTALQPDFGRIPSINALAHDARLAALS
jgi:hypothetical protein